MAVRCPTGAPKTSRDEPRSRRRESNQQGAEEVEPRRAGAGEPRPLPPVMSAGKRQRPSTHHFQGGDGRRLEISGRIRPQWWYRQEAVLMLGDPLPMLVSMDQGLREVGPLRTAFGRTPVVAVMPEGMGSQP